MKILLVGALPGSLINFRGALLKAMGGLGHTVFAAANKRDPGTEAQLKDIGVTYCPIRIARAGMNPWADMVTLLDLVRLMRRVRPDVVLSYTIKPVIYGGLAARLCGGCTIYSLVTGLGYTFMEATSARHGLAGWLARSLYRLSLAHSSRVFFQNPDDRDAFLTMKLVSSGQSVVVNGSGVDLEFFPFRDSPGIINPDLEAGAAPVWNGAAVTMQASGKAVRFLLIARLLRDKGIGEYVAAARWLKRSYPHAEFHLIGAFDPNPAGLKPEEVRAWEDEGLIQFHGWQADVRPFISGCHVYVLPSYREGTPRTVLEAMATGRAIITTDAPGCRETVLSVGARCRVEECSDVRSSNNNAPPLGMAIGRNGVLVPVKNVTALAAAMEFFVQAPDQVVTMGRESRRYAEARYDVRKVNAVMMNEMGLEK